MAGIDNETAKSLDAVAAQALATEQADQLSTDGQPNAATENKPIGQTPEERQAEAMDRALKLVGGYEWAIKLKDKRLNVSEDQYKAAQKYLPDLIIKYDLDKSSEPPEWLKKWLPELMAIFFFGTLLYGTLSQVKELKRIDAEARAKEQEKQQQQQAAARPAGAPATEGTDVDVQKREAHGTGWR